MLRIIRNENENQTNPHLIPAIHMKHVVLIFFLRSFSFFFFFLFGVLFYGIHFVVCGCMSELKFSFFSCVVFVDDCRRRRFFFFFSHNFFFFFLLRFAEQHIPFEKCNMNCCAYIYISYPPLIYRPYIDYLWPATMFCIWFE